MFLLADPFIANLIVYGVTLIAAGVGYYLTQRKLKKKTAVNLAEVDYTLSNTSTQGAYVPWLVGRRRIGSVVAYVGNRKTRQEFQRVRSGGKGGRKRRTRHPPTGNLIYSEDAWHLLCVGPAVALYRIWADGKVVLDASAVPITPTTHPSGSSFGGLTDTPGLGYIYWGESTQPLNPQLALSDRTGISSRWPSVCYIYWENLDIGTSPRWPQMEYEVEVAPIIENTEILTAEATVDMVTVDGATQGANLGYVLAQILYEQYPHGVNCDLAEWDFEAGTSGGSGTPFGHIEAQGDFLSTVATHVSTASSPDVTMVVETLDLLPWASPYYSGGGVVAGDTYLIIYLNNFEPSGDVQSFRAYLVGPSGQEITLHEDNGMGVLYDGVDDLTSAYVPPSGWEYDEQGPGTHTIRRIVSMDTVQVDIDEAGAWRVDLDYTVDITGTPSYFGAEVGVTFTPLTSIPPSGTVYDVMVLSETEKLLGSTIAIDGEETSSIIGKILQDVGLFVPRQCNGLLGYASTRRADDADVVWLTEDQLVSKDFEVVARQDDKFIDRIMYSYHDQDRNYRQSIVQIDEDGQAVSSGNVRGQVVPVANVVLNKPAGVIAERRSQEELAAPQGVLFEMTRGGHRLIPGQVIRIPDFAYTLRVVHVEARDDSDVTKIEAIVDTIGVALSGYATPYTPGSGNPSLDPEVPLQRVTLEVPAMVGTPGTVLVGSLRIRANPQVNTHLFHISPDDVTYTLAASEGTRQTGGTLTSALGATEGWELDQGPTFDLVGSVDDFLDVVEDLTAQPDEWRSGRQLAVIGGEFFFVRQVTPLGGISYRLDGLIRARFNGEREAHVIGAEVFLVTSLLLNGINDPMIYPGSTLYSKQQPLTNTALDLALVTADLQTVFGHGVVPMRPSAFRVTAPAQGTPAYGSGDDIIFNWNHASTLVPDTGGGEGPAGFAMGVSPLRPGEVAEIEVYDAGSSLVATYTLSTSFIWTYTQAMRLTDLGGELDFSVQLRTVNGGWKSKPSSLSIEAL